MERKTRGDEGLLIATEPSVTSIVATPQSFSCGVFMWCGGMGQWRRAVAKRGLTKPVRGG